LINRYIQGVTEDIGLFRGKQASLLGKMALTEKRDEEARTRKETISTKLTRKKVTEIATRTREPLPTSREDRHKARTKIKRSIDPFEKNCQSNWPEKNKKERVQHNTKDTITLDGKIPCK